MPYTLGLLGSIPRLDVGRGQPLVPIEGQPPSLVALPPGCPFGPRCPLHVDGLRRRRAGAGARPRRRGPDHAAACIRAGELAVADAEGGDLAVEVFDAEPPPVAEQARRPAPNGTWCWRWTNWSGTTRSAPAGCCAGARSARCTRWTGSASTSAPGETLGLVGESGCGKSTTIMEILDLDPPQAGSIQVLGSDVASLTRADRKRIRRDLQIVFQDPMASLDPRLPVRDLIAEPLRIQGFAAGGIAHGCRS